MFLKKITILSTLFFFLWVSNVFSYNISITPWSDWENWSTDTQINLNTTSTPTPDKDTSFWASIDSKWNIIEWSEPFSSKSSSAQFNCTPGKDSLCSDQFKIDTGKFSPGGKWLNKTTSKATINWFFTVLIKKLMVALWSLALIIMVVWAWFMITAMWKDDSLNKWKTIFKAWIIALVIALASYFMVSFLSYILYTIG